MQPEGGVSRGWDIFPDNPRREIGGRRSPARSSSNKSGPSPSPLPHARATCTQMRNNFAFIADTPANPPRRTTEPLTLPPTRFYRPSRLQTHRVGEERVKRRPGAILDGCNPGGGVSCGPGTSAGTIRGSKSAAGDHQRDRAATKVAPRRPRSHTRARCDRQRDSNPRPAITRTITAAITTGAT
jgi:hypothetical protein